MFLIIHFLKTRKIQKMSLWAAWHYWHRVLYKSRFWRLKLFCFTFKTNHCCLNKNSIKTNKINFGISRKSQRAIKNWSFVKTPVNIEVPWKKNWCVPARFSLKDLLGNVCSVSLWNVLFWQARHEKIFSFSFSKIMFLWCRHVVLQSCQQIAC